MSDKIKAASDIATPIVEVITSGADSLVKGAPVVVEAGSDAVEVMVELVDKTGFSKKVVIGAAAAVGVTLLGGGLAYWYARRRGTSVEEVVEEATHKVAETVSEKTK